MNKVKKIGLFVICVFFIACSNKPSTDKNEEEVILNNEEIVNNFPKGISIGDTIILHKKEEWNVKQKEFVPATKTSLYGNKKSLTSDYFIKSFPNGTKAVVLDYYEEKLVNGSLWKVYKVKAESSEGWVADFEIEKIN